MKPHPTRRSFLGISAALATTPSLSSHTAAAVNIASKYPLKTAGIVDWNLSIGHWPFRTLRWGQAASLPTLNQVFLDLGVYKAWVSAFEGIFHRDLAPVNESLAASCAEHGHGVLQPVGSINPTLPAWQDDLKRCTAEHGMKVIRLHPNYHGYTLADSKFLELLEAATGKKLLVQISAQMEDERTQHPAVQVKPVDFKPLPAALKRVPEARVMVLNANRAMSMTALQGTNVILDIAMLEGVGGIENLLKDWPLEQVVFGSHAPLFYFESAKLKLQESELTEKQLNAITHENAQRLLA